jgi:hypothetical protein
MANERRLILYPLVHTKRESGAIIGNDDLAYAVANHIYHHTLSLGEDLSGFKIYADGMPNVNQSLVDLFLRENSYSPTTTIIKMLQHRGATLLGTEDPRILNNLYMLLSRVRQDVPDSAELFTQYRKSTVGPRDFSIAKRIDSSLQPGETGVLFIGMDHKVENYLNRNIKIILPGDIFAGLPEHLLATNAGYTYAREYVLKGAHLRERPGTT